MSNTRQRSGASSEASLDRSTRTGVVTFLDVLGWRGIYNREDAPITKLSSLVKELEDAATNLRGRSTTTEIRSISDTIVVYSTNVNQSNIKETIDDHGDICARAVANSIVARIPVRGATAFGEFEVQGNIYVGKAIDEAASWYEAGDWIGVHLTPSAMLCARNSTELKHWREYQPPLKAGTKHATPCVNWLEQWKRTVSGKDPVQQLRDVFRDMGPITPDFAMKFINTLTYFEALAKPALKEAAS